MATPAVYGTALENGRIEPYAEVDDYGQGGDVFLIRMTAIHPYKDYANGSDELLVHIDLWNQTTGVSGRWLNVLLPERNSTPAPQGEKTLRRHSLYFRINQLLAQTPFDETPSPVYPNP